MRSALLVTCVALFALPAWGAEKFTSKPTAFKEIALNWLAEYVGRQQDQGRDNVGLALDILSGSNSYPADTVETMGSMIFINTGWKKIAECRYFRISGKQSLEGINISYEIKDLRSLNWSSMQRIPKSDFGASYWNITVNGSEYLSIEEKKVFIQRDGQFYFEKNDGKFQNMTYDIGFTNDRAMKALAFVKQSCPGKSTPF